jgi:heterodisulfide reductase subunit A
MKERVKAEARAALENGWDGVFGLRGMWGQVGPYVFTDPRELEELELEPKYPLTKTIRLMLEKVPDLHMAAVLRGCDVRALRELEKTGDIRCDGLHIIGIDCSREQAEECNCEKPVYDTSQCTGCWKCIEACKEGAIQRINVCPVLVDSEWNERLIKRKAIYTAFPQAVPLKACRDAEHCLKVRGVLDCKGCENACVANAIIPDDEERVEEIEVGSIILATGYDTLDPTPMKQFGYGTYPNVFTSLEFERLNNATGPTGGKVLMRDGNGNFTRPPESVAMFHCIGSRDVNYHEYCSRVCCMYALKYAHLIHEKVGHHTKIFNFYIDMRCFGKGYEEFFRRVQEEGTTFIRGKAAEITDKAIKPEEEGKLIVIGEDTLIARRVRVPVDMVVLCTAMEPRSDAPEVARIFGISQGGDRFFLEEHPKLGPMSTATDGIFLAGACQGPKDIPDAVSHASGAAAQSLALAARGVVQISSTTSWIDPDVCAGCQTCIKLCAYSAIDFNERRKVSVVNEALCKGCGSCAGFCPSGAARIKHFTARQVFAEIEGILESTAEVSC